MARAKLVIIRYGEHVGPPEGTIAAHQEIIRREGHVWFGKIGARLAQERTSALVAQAESGVPTYVLLFKRSAGRTVLHAAPLMEVRFDPPEDRRTIPAYYSAFPSQPTTWFKLASMVQIEPWATQQIWIASSRRPFREVLASMASVFYADAEPKLFDEATSPPASTDLR